MTPTTPRPLRRILLAAVAAVVALAFLAPGSPAAALTPEQPGLKGAQGFDGPGAGGYHRLIWGIPTDAANGTIESWQVERWNADQTIKVATYNVAYGAGPDLTVANMADGVLYKYRIRAKNADGFGPWSQWEPVKVHPGVNHWSPFLNETDLIASHYQDFLGRNPSVGESSTAAANMSDAAGVVTFLNGLANNPTRVKNRYPVLRLYLAFFDRAADHEGLDYWEGRLDAGTANLTSVAEFFAKSNEFKVTYANLGNADFVELVYQNVLDRQPDQAGLSYWKGQLDQKKITRGKLMIGFSESAEGKALRRGDAVVSDLYDAMIGAPPENDVMATYAEHVLAGGTAGDLALFIQYLNSYQP